MDHLLAEWALLPDGFARNVRLTIDAGTITDVTPNAAPGNGTPIVGVLIPGMPNLHSHGFQRVFAGLTNWSGAGGDFWTWRDAMYRAVAGMTPELYRPIFAWVCKELLKAGFTSLAEFHYVQHLPDSTQYTPATAMADALIEAAAAAFMPLTLLVGIYETGGFDGEPLAGGQKRFDTSAETALRLAGDLAPRAHDGLAIGLAPHSLRAVPPASLARAVTGFRAHHAGPIHIHVAEQTAEVAACIRVLGAPPVAWLLDHAPVDAGWCLIHATHTGPAEIAAIARAGAVTGLCPSTEADLGDGIFGFPALQAARGAFGIGTDSNTALDPFGELRLLEYAQRLNNRSRNVAAGGAGHTGRALWQGAAAGGAQALGRCAGRIEAGRRADFAVIAATEEARRAAPDFILDAAIFAATSSRVTDVMAGGVWVVKAGVHRDEAAIDAAYGSAIAKLRRGLDLG
jgi:formimidoylglutamate deiminase